MDMHNVFLPVLPGFSKRQGGKVYRLQKSLYSLKQAPRCWFDKLNKSLKQYGFHQSYSDYSLFTYSSGNIFLCVLVYVDDLIVTGNDLASLQKFKAHLRRCFHMKDLGSLKYFLGIEVTRNKNGIYLCQQKYALDILSNVGFLGAKPINFPMEQDHKLGKAKGPILSHPNSYRCLLDYLIYLMITRSNLAYPLQVLSQFMHKPRQEIRMLFFRFFIISSLL